MKNTSMVRVGNCTKVKLSGGMVELGEEFAFINPEDIEDSISIRYMIKIIGEGPFVLLEVEHFSRFGEPVYVMIFKDRKGRRHEIRSNYFRKVE